MKEHGLSVPHELKGHIDEDLLKRIREYEAEKTRFGFISTIFGNIVTVVFIFGGVLNIYNSWVAELNLLFITSGLLFFLLLSAVSTVLDIPFDLYGTFRIENKYGFNTMTPKLWMADFFKSLLLSSALIGIIITAGFWIIQSSPDFWWIWVWGLFLVFSIFMMYISPYVIEPLFNKFTPIDDAGLEESLKNMMEKANIKVGRVFKMDASKRSRHTNAYFTGIGRVKRIILYDTLIEKFDRDEILSVLAHEAGHWKKKHVLKMIIGMEIVSFVGIYISFRILRTDFLASLFDIQQSTFFAKLVLLGFIGGIVSFPFAPLGAYISRRFERQADRFACELSENKEAMATALIKLSKDNLSNLHPHPLYAAFYYSHPPVAERIRDIKNTSIADWKLHENFFDNTTT
jgi:STE24 endopeptidase